MKAIILTTLIGAFIAAAGSAQAAQYVSDPLILDLATNGQIVSPHGIWAGR